jgi:glycosidase
MYPFIKYMAEDESASFAAQKDQTDSLFQHYKRLSEIRRSQALLTDSDATLRVVQHTADVYEYAIEKAGQTLSVVLNRQPTPQTVTRTAAQKDLLTGTSASRFTVPAYGGLILQ